MWKVWEFLGHPVFQQEKRGDNRPSPILFYQHHAWWAVMTEPMAGQKKLEPKLLGKAEIGKDHNTMYWPAMEWRFPPHSPQVAKHIEILSNDYWVNDQYMHVRNLLEPSLRVAADERKLVMELQLQSNMDADYIRALEAEIHELQADKGNGKGQAQKGKFIQSVHKTGWMNKMTALIGAIHQENAPKVAHLCQRFLRCTCKCVCIVAVMLICVFYRWCRFSNPDIL
jgi:hypothetical protein